MGKLPINYKALVNVANSAFTGNESDETTFSYLRSATLADEDHKLGIGIKDKAISVYNNCQKASVEWARNLCLLSSDQPHLHISANWGASWQLFMMKLLCKYYGVCFTTDLPKASELLDNWPIEQADYYGTNAPRFCGRVNASGSCLTGYNANNQNIGFVAGCLMTGIIDGSAEETLSRWGMDILNYAKLFIDAWKSRFTSSGDYYNDGWTGGENNRPFSYWTNVAFSLLIIIYQLWRFGLISDEDLPTYLDWVNTVWRQYLLGLDASGIIPQRAINFLFMELLYNNLVKSSTLSSPVNQTIDSLVSIVNNTTDPVRFELLYFANEWFGVLIKRPLRPSAGDTITIDAWESPVTIEGDGIELSQTSISGSVDVTINSITKSWWRIKRIIT